VEAREDCDRARTIAEASTGANQTASGVADGDTRRESAGRKPQNESPRGRETCQKGEAFPSSEWLGLLRRRRSGKQTPAWWMQRRHQRSCDGCVSNEHVLNWTCERGA